MQPDKVHCTVTLISAHISEKQGRPTYKNLIYYKSLNPSGKYKWYWGTTDLPFWKNKTIKLIKANMSIFITLRKREKF